MLETVIQDLTKKQRPYYQSQGDYIKGINNNYWLIFKHRDASNLTIIEQFLNLKNATKIELILQGKQGIPDDFLYWLAQQRPDLLNRK